MSEENDQLFSALQNIMDTASDTVSVETMSNSLKNIGIILATFRSFMIQNEFSPEWTERACAALWNSFFPNNPMDV